MSNVKYPDITANILGADGNVFNILGIAKRALKKGGIPQEEIKEFMAEATKGDYNHVLKTISEWMNIGIEGDEDEEDNN